MPVTLKKLPADLAAALVNVTTAHSILGTMDVRATDAATALKQVRKFIRDGGKLALDRPRSLVFTTTMERLFVEGDNHTIGALLAALTPEPTISDTLDAIRDIGMVVVYKSHLKEYRVNFPVAAEETAYYTDCPHDALATAKVMRASRPVTF